MMAANLYFSQIEDLMFEVAKILFTSQQFSLLVNVKDRDLIFFGLMCLFADVYVALQ